MNNLIITLCEGPHDVAFLYRILKTMGFKSDEKKKLDDYPFPMNQFILKQTENLNYAELNLSESKRALLPIKILNLGTNFVFLYAMGGDSKKNTRQIFTDFFLTLLSTSIVEFKHSIKLLYFFDADENGVEKRSDQVSKEIQESIQKKNPNVDVSFEDGIYQYTQLLEFGYYIFANDAGKGNLEDILLPLMREGSEGVFKGAEQYYSTHKKGKTNNKAIIGITGQLERPGRSNTSIISDTKKLITDDRIKANEHCKAIIKFFEGFILYPTNE